MPTPPRPQTLHWADIQLAAVHHMRWLPGRVTVDGAWISVEGWALCLWEPQEQLRFLVNGEDADELAWPLPSEDLVPFFGDVPQRERSRFALRHRLRGGRTLFPDGFVRLNVTSRFGEHGQSYRTAWWLADPADEAPLPSGPQITRVIGAPDSDAYRLGGATTVKRFDAYLRQRFDRPLDTFDAILDWGCGAGRLTRYLPGPASRVTGVDIDSDNIATCARLLPGRRFLTIGTEPPTPLADASFDLILGVSVLTHLSEPHQHAWLSEVARLLRPGGLALITISGFACAALGRDVQQQMAAHSEGLVAVGSNPQLDDAGIAAGYYIDVRHSHDYVHATWSRHLDVLDIVPGLGGPQDAVVLRRPR